MIYVYVLDFLLPLPPHLLKLLKNKNERKKFNVKLQYLKITKHTWKQCQVQKNATFPRYLPSDMNNYETLFKKSA